MNKDRGDGVDLSDAPKCPEDGYGLFVANEEDDGDWKCLGCGEVYDDDEVSP